MNWCVPTSGNQEETRHQQKGKKTITCFAENFVPLVAVTQQKVTPSARHDHGRRNFVSDKQVEETMLKLLELSLEVSSTTTQYWRGEHLLPKREARERAHCGKRHRSAVTGVQDDKDQARQLQTQTFETGRWAPTSQHIERA